MNTESNAFDFTHDWFSNNIPRWTKHILRARSLKGQHIEALELGCFEGRSAVWLLQNVLSHPKAHITCIDNFSKIKGIKKQPTVGETKNRFLSNTKQFGSKVTLIEMDTRDALKSQQVLSKSFDFIYIDAGRHSKNVLEDAILAFPLLKVGGYIVFDDYTSNEKHDYTCPKKGIDAFLDIFSDELHVRNSSWQVIAKKKKPSRSTRNGCKSELD